VKYGLYGAVLAGLIGGTVAWTNVDKTVTLVVDGKSTQIHTTASDVHDVLQAAGYHDGSHDLLAPSLTSAVHNGTKIVLERGRLLRLDVNGVQRQVWTTAPTVAVAMSQLGYSTAAFTSVSRSKRLPLTPTNIAVRTPKVVQVVVDGTTRDVTTTDATAGQLLSDLGITLGPDDVSSMSASATLQSGGQLVVERVVHRTVVTSRPLPFSKMSHKDATLPAGQTQVVRPGRRGLEKITWALVFIDGKMAGRTRIGAVTVRAPQDRVTQVGTKQPVAAKTPSPGAPNVPPAPTPSPGSAQAIARHLLLARGWGAAQFSCLVTLWNHESGWRVHAANSSSGAYGIPQALPGSKMASAGPDWENNATTQIEWGLGYIAERYSTPCGAWAQWQANGGWY
jgi:uncharacterized protein YabE (DUF348 family)